MLCINSIAIIQQWLKPYCIAPPAYPKNQLKPPQIRPDFSTRNPYGSTGHLTGLSLWRMPRSAYLKKCVRVPYWVKPVSSSADHLALVRTRLTTFFSVENHLGGGSLPQDGLSTFMIYINIHNSGRCVGRFYGRSLANYQSAHKSCFNFPCHFGWARYLHVICILVR